MATVTPPADQAANLLQKLSIETQPKDLEVPEPAKKFGSVDSGNAANGQIPSNERTVTPLLPDSSMCFFPNGYSSAYYYPGFEGTGNDWDYSRYMNPEGVDMTSGVYGENSSLLYHGYGYGYPPYSPVGSPVPTMGNDGQLYGPQQYQYPPYFGHMPPTSGPYTSNPAAPTQGEVPSSAAGDQKTLPAETVNNNTNGVANTASVKVNNGSAPVKPAYQNTSFNSNSFGHGTLPGGIPTSSYQDPRFGFDGLCSPIPWMDAPVFSDGQSRPTTISKSNNGSARNQNMRSNSHYMGLQHPRPMSGMGSAQGYKLYGQYGSAFGSGMDFGSNGYGMRAGGRWMTVDGKNKPRGRGSGYYGYGNDNMDGLNELNRGPRGKGAKNQKGFVPVALAVKGQNVPLNVTGEEDKNVTPDRGQYNLPDFPEEYADAKFFIIKSYSEDDVHKSIKYNVWASTPNGNKKLDAAYKEAQEKPNGCPVFLFFSVNTSGQFVGLAEMIGPVDFEKSCEYWQQDKWNGSFPVKWHIVKDVPNSLLKHITLENNENKPVTNSRDTQEVKLEPGLKMIKIFKEFSSKTCILDDFGFYENRQKTIQEKKAKQQFQKQVWEGKPADEKKDLTNGEPNGSKGDLKHPDNGSVVKAGDAIAAVSEKSVVTNGVANGC